MCVKHKRLENKGIFRADDSLLILGHYVRNCNANTSPPIRKMIVVIVDCSDVKGCCSHDEQIKKYV